MLPKCHKAGRDEREENVGTAVPLVSVLIGAYNHGAFISEAVDSALSQSYPNIEVIVVDDGSTDNTKDVLRDYGDRITYSYQQNSGPAAARNRASKMASGSLLAILDADDVWLPDKVRKQLNLLQSAPDLDLVFSRFAAIDEAGNSLGFIYPEKIPDQLELIPVPDVDNGYVIEGALVEALLSGCFIPHPSVIMRRETLDAVGGYDASLGQAEDVDLWKRMALQDAHFCFLDEILLNVRKHGSNISHSHATQAVWSIASKKKILHMVADREPRLRGLVRKSLAGNLKLLGDYLAAEGRLTEARREYWEAMRYAFRPIYPVSWAATFLGPTGHRLLKMLNHGSDIFDSASPGREVSPNRR